MKINQFAVLALERHVRHCFDYRAYRSCSLDLGGGVLLVVTAESIRKSVAAHENLRLVARASIFVNAVLFPV